VPEYLAVILENQQIERRVQEQGGRYRLLKPHKDGTLRSRIFPGLWLDIDAYWRNDRAALLATLERGIATESKS
jgi:Uma2 family endonuclease